MAKPCKVRLRGREGSRMPRCEGARARGCETAYVVVSACALLTMLAAAGEARAQDGRVVVGALAGSHSQDSDQVEGQSAVLGIVGGVRLTPAWSIEIEASRPTHIFTREYTGIGQSLAEPGASREEIERLGVVQRFNLERHVRLTLSAGVVYEPLVHPRWRPRFFAGLTHHRVRDRFMTTIVSLPAGVAPELLRTVRDTDESLERTLGAITVGAGLGIGLTRHLLIAPEVRYDYGSFGDEINNALRSSMRAVWLF